MVIMIQPPLQRPNTDRHPSQRLWWRLSLVLLFLLVVLWRPTSPLHPDVQVLLSIEGDAILDGFNLGAKQLISPRLSSLSNWMQARGWNDSWLWEKYKPSTFFATIEKRIWLHGWPMVFPLSPTLAKLYDTEGVHVQAFLHGRAILVQEGSRTHVVVALEGILKSRPQLACLILFNPQAHPRDYFVGEADTLDFPIEDGKANCGCFTFRDHHDQAIHRIAIRHSRFVDILNQPP